MNCKTCGSPIMDGAAFCLNCGAKVEAQEDATVMVGNTAPQAPMAPQQPTYAPAPQAPAAPQQPIYAPAPQAPVAPQQPAYTPAPQAPAAPQQPTYAPAPQTPMAPQQPVYDYAPQAPMAPQQPTYAPAPQAPAAPQQPTYAPAPQAPAYAPYGYQPEPKKGKGKLIAIICIIVAILAAVAITLVIVLGGDDDKDNDKGSTTLTGENAFVGEWVYSEEGTEEGIDYKVLIKLTLDEDGSFTMSSEEYINNEKEDTDVFTGTYTVDGDTVTLIEPRFPDEPLVFTKEGNKLTRDGFSYALTKK